MFQVDQPAIAEYAWSTPRHVAEVIMFARLTIRRHFFVVPSVVAAVREHGYVALPDSSSRATYNSLYSGSVAPPHCADDPQVIFRKCLQVPGIGMAKAGFIVQMLTGQCGCLDTHNLKRFGLDANLFRTDAPWSKVEKRLNLYWAICESHGSAFLWDSWCELIAGKYPYHFVDAEAVSQLHVTAILGE